MQTTLIRTVAGRVLRLATAAVASVSVIACTPNPYVTNAERNEVITLGDSIFDLNGQIQANLENWAGETFRDYTLSGAELSGGIYATPVDEQYRDARRNDANIDTILMNGGGNDILLPAKYYFDPYGCKTTWYRRNISSSCIGLIEEQYVTAVNLLNRMDADGVGNVVYLGYYELPRSNANLGQALQYGDAYLSYACEVSTAASCRFVDPRGQIPGSMVESDDIHPTPAGSLKLAQLIWPIFQPLL